MTGRLSWSLWGLAAFLSAGIAVFSYRFLVGIGPMAPAILANLFAKPWLYIHITGAATALLIGPLQFVPRIRQRRPVHRWLGRIYVVGCLIGGAGGLVVAFGSTAGPIATAGFGSLAVTWIVTNVQGWRMARARRFDVHRAWMIRSFALTFAAVTLRLYLPLIQLTGAPFVDGYRAISFLCWIPNLIAAELYIRRVFTSPQGDLSPQV
ncbi:MAG TPA: DUF2306 domain-containing protein [Caulobacteraceae bacterium]|jgi:hypothetical protein